MTTSHRHAPPAESARDANRLGFWTGFGLTIITSGIGITGLASGLLWMGWAGNLVAFIAVIAVAASTPTLGLRFFVGAVKGFLCVLALAVVLGIAIGLMLAG